MSFGFLQLYDGDDSCVGCCRSIWEFVDSLDETSNFTCVYGVADESGANIAQHFEPSYQFVEEAESEGGKVLIHCGAGASRSATLCAAYLMRVRRWKVKQTLELVILSCLSVYCLQIDYPGQRPALLLFLCVLCFSGLVFNSSLCKKMVYASANHLLQLLANVAYFSP